MSLKTLINKIENYKLKSNKPNLKTNYLLNKEIYSYNKLFKKIITSKLYKIKKKNNLIKKLKVN